MKCFKQVWVLAPKEKNKINQKHSRVDLPPVSLTLADAPTCYAERCRLGVLNIDGMATHAHTRTPTPTQRNKQRKVAVVLTKAHEIGHGLERDAVVPMLYLHQEAIENGSKRRSHRSGFFCSSRFVSGEGKRAPCVPAFM